MFSTLLVTKANDFKLGLGAEGVKCIKVWVSYNLYLIHKTCDDTSRLVSSWILFQLQGQLSFWLACCLEPVFVFLTIWDVILKSVARMAGCAMSK